MKIFGKILLSAIIWFGIAFAVSLGFVLIGFVVESVEFPLFSAMIGMLAALTTFVFGLIFSIIRILNNADVPKDEMG